MDITLPTQEQFESQITSEIKNVQNVIKAYKQLPASNVMNTLKDADDVLNELTTSLNTLNNIKEDVDTHTSKINEMLDNIAKMEQQTKQDIELAKVTLTSEIREQQLTHQNLKQEQLRLQQEHEVKLKALEAKTDLAIERIKTTAQDERIVALQEAYQELVRRNSDYDVNEIENATVKLQELLSKIEDEANKRIEHLRSEWESERTTIMTANDNEIQRLSNKYATEEAIMEENANATVEEVQRLTVTAENLENQYLKLIGGEK